MTAETKTADHSETTMAIPDRVNRTSPESPLRDVMQGDLRWEIPVHDHGFVALVDAMPRLVPEGQTADSAIVQAARARLQLQWTGRLRTGHVHMPPMPMLPTSPRIHAASMYTHKCQFENVLHQCPVSSVNSAIS